MRVAHHPRRTAFSAILPANGAVRRQADEERDAGPDHPVRRATTPAPAQRAGRLWLDLPDGTTVGDVIRQLDVKVKDRLIVGLDGAYAPADTPLHDNAELTLVTPMEGG